MLVPRWLTPLAATMEMPGVISPTTMRDHARSDGARTALPVSVILTAIRMLPLAFGTRRSKLDLDF